MKLVYAATIVLCYSAFCWGCWYSYRRRHPALTSTSVGEAADLLIAYASQTGRAAELAQSTALQLSEGQRAAAVVPLDRLNDQLLRQSKNILFVVSTYGEGDPPDMAARFANRYLRHGGHDLSHLRYGVLALGDRQYRHFCGFGRKLSRGLQSQAAQPLFDPIEVDRQDPQALALWQQRVVELGGVAPSGLTPSFISAQLEQRECLNSGSAGAPVFHVVLSLPQSSSWQAGDIASITPGNRAAEVQSFLNELELDGDSQMASAEGCQLLRRVLTYRRLPNTEEQLRKLRPLSLDELLKRLPPLPTRDYSIASIPEDGRLELLVRQVHGPDGCLGLGSGWLTEHAPVHSAIPLRIRSNPAFHAPSPEVPLILIGNGTGMAGLRAHLRAREQSGAHRNWLMFGERNAAFDLHYANDLAAWQASGHFSRLDFAYSRDGGPHRYVQDLVAANAGELRRWVAEGAAVYLCGSRQGMAAGVEQALQGVLTEAGLAQLQEQGRMRRDVY